MNVPEFGPRGRNTCEVSLTQEYKARVILDWENEGKAIGLVNLLEQPGA